jgi:hypothetical protein
MQFEEKFIAFIDVLGFKNMVEEAESGSGISLTEIMSHLSMLGTAEDSSKFEKYGPTTCPQSETLRRDLNFKITQISDCAIISSEVSPAGVINLLSHCFGAVIKLLLKGIMCRGYITKGSIFHNEINVIGSGYQNAYKKESGVTAFRIEANERGTPFVEVDPIVCDYIENSTDSCVREMFSRMTKTEDNLTAVFPFQRLSHSLGIGGFGQPEEFNPDKEKEFNNTIRTLLQTLIERVEVYVDPKNEKALTKSRHYIKAINEQLRVCDRIDEIIDTECQPFPRSW